MVLSGPSFTQRMVILMLPEAAIAYHIGNLTHGLGGLIF